MLRSLFNFLSIVSLLLCAATFVLWAVTLSRGSSTEFVMQEHRWRIAVSSGRILIDDLPKQVQERELSLPLAQRRYDDAVRLHAQTQDRVAAIETDQAWEQTLAEYSAAINGSHAAAMQLAIELLPAAPKVTLLYLPLLPAAAITAVLPLVWLKSRLIQLRSESENSRRGHCPTCGYDLRASTDRCPECGAVKGAA